ncbi:MAG: hypothetical protein M3Z25_14870 [Actinomycetota bacterium]|nr:hypothetical protein [Actinomycetota bacterium]
MRTKRLGEITAERMRAVVRLTEERLAAAPAGGALGRIHRGVRTASWAADPARPAQVPDQGWRPDEHQDRAVDQSVRPVVAGVLDRSPARGLPLGVRGHDRAVRHGAGTTRSCRTSGPALGTPGPGAEERGRGPDDEEAEAGQAAM